MKATTISIKEEIIALIRTDTRNRQEKGEKVTFKSVLEEIILKHYKGAAG